MQILLEKRAVEIMRDTTSPGFYSRIFLVKKKTDRFRLIIDLFSLNKMMRIEHFQMETTASIRRSFPAGTFHRSCGRIPPYSHHSSFSQVPEIFPGRNCLPIPGSSIWDFNSALRFYKPDGDCGRIYSISGAQHSPVLRRLAYPSSVPGVSPVRPVTVMGNHYKPRSNTKSSEIRPSSFSGLQFCRHEVSDSFGHCQSSRRESTKFFSCFSGFCRFRSLLPENFCLYWDHSVQQQI